MVGLDFSDPPLTAQRSGTARWCKWSSLASAREQQRRCCLLLSHPAPRCPCRCLSRSAANPDRDDRLEPLAALIAAVVATTGLGLVFDGVLLRCVPAWRWPVSMVARLSRDAGAAGRAPPAALEWYPVGHLVFWAAILGAHIVIAAMLTLGVTWKLSRVAARRSRAHAASRSCAIGSVRIPRFNYSRD